jgi:hypothetical protein
VQSAATRAVVADPPAAVLSCGGSSRPRASSSRATFIRWCAAPPFTLRTGRILLWEGWGDGAADAFRRPIPDICLLGAESTFSATARPQGVTPIRPCTAQARRPQCVPGGGVRQTGSKHDDVQAKHRAYAARIAVAGGNADLLRVNRTRTEPTE